MENSPLRNSPQTISRRHSWICPSSSLSDPEAPPAQLGETTPLAHESGSKHGSSPENAPRIIQSFARSTSIPNFSRILRRHDFARFTMDSSTPVHGPANARRHRGGAPIKRWEGKTKMSTSWDYLRRDKEIWDPKGDCLVHFYSPGTSRRGPSLRVSGLALLEADCAPLLARYDIESMPEAPSSSSSNSSQELRSDYELYIPAPEGFSHNEAFRWHLTTRNFFAFILEKPVVGQTLGQAMADLLERMEEFRSETADNKVDLMSYARKMGYLDFTNCPEHALAMLYYAERSQCEALWIKAFSHCVGMNDSLQDSCEFEQISRITKAHITRSYLEMQIRVSRAAKAIGNFLESELSSAHLGLPPSACNHLDLFRTFIHSHYVEKFGYWPPPSSSSYPKDIFDCLYHDFSSLYAFLADTTSGDSVFATGLPSGGLCVTQNLHAFNTKHSFPPLPHTLPLLPRIPPNMSRNSSHKSLHVLSPNGRQAKKGHALRLKSAVLEATNSFHDDRPASDLVYAYRNFELRSLDQQEDKVLSISDARKVRWFLIYSTLQMLVSVVQVPFELECTEMPRYPLCCAVPDSFPWIDGTKSLLPSRSSTIRNVQSREVPMEHSTEYEKFLSAPDRPLHQRSPSPISIHPDCEYSQTGAADKTVSPTVDASTPISRPSSLKPVRRISSLSASLKSRRNSSNTKSSSPTKTSGAFCEILVRGYGNGLNHTKTIMGASSSSTSLSSCDRSSTFLQTSDMIRPIPSRSATDLSIEERATDSLAYDEQTLAALEATRFNPIPIDLPLDYSEFAQASPFDSTGNRTPLLDPQSLEFDLSLQTIPDLDQNDCSESDTTDLSTVWTDDSKSAASSLSCSRSNSSSTDAGSKRRSSIPALPLSSGRALHSALSVSSPPKSLHKQVRFSSKSDTKKVVMEPNSSLTGGFVPIVPARSSSKRTSLPSVARSSLLRQEAERAPPRLLRKHHSAPDRAKIRSNTPSSSTETVHALGKRDSLLTKSMRRSLTVTRRQKNPVEPKSKLSPLVNETETKWRDLGAQAQMNLIDVLNMGPPPSTQAA